MTVEWVDVNARLPEVSDEFLSLPASRRVLVAFGATVVIARLVDVYDRSIKWMDNGGRLIGMVDYWAELPEAPAHLASKEAT